MSEREEEKMTLVHAAYRVCDLAVRIEQAETEEEENDLCDQRDRFLSLFRKADASRQSILEEAAKVAECELQAARDQRKGFLQEGGEDTNVIDGAIEASERILTAIRSLSHGKAPDKEGEAG